MLSCVTSAATDVDEFSALVRPAGGMVMATASGEFSAQITQIDLGRVWIQHGQESLPRIWEADRRLDRCAVSFFTNRESPECFSHGLSVGAGELALHGPFRPICLRSVRSMRWASMSVPTDDWMHLNIATDGRTPIPQDDAVSLAPPARSMAKLQRLHATAAHLAEHAAEFILNPEVARGLEQEMMLALIDCTSAPSAEANTAACRRHGEIIQRFRDVLEREPDRALYVPELCSALGVSERTLRICFHEHFGIGPKQYLFLRRMHLAHRALRRVESMRVRVTDIATEFGFWELGRFAVFYKSIFGESPSLTLHQARC